MHTRVSNGFWCSGTDLATSYLSISLDLYDIQSFHPAKSKWNIWCVIAINLNYHLIVLFIYYNNNVMNNQML